jgi:hypothetical protein
LGSNSGSRSGSNSETVSYSVNCSVTLTEKNSGSDLKTATAMDLNSERTMEYRSGLNSEKNSESSS